MAVYFADDFGHPEEASRRVKDGSLVRVTRGVYSDDISLPREEVVRQNWRTIVGHLMPNAVITGRTGFDGVPVTQGTEQYLYVSHPRSIELALPGLTVIPDASSAGPHSDDTPLADGLYQASEPRALLDNVKPSRRVKGRPARTLTRDELHDRVVRLTTTRNNEQQKRILDGVARLANETSNSAAAEDIQVFFESATGRRPTVQTGSVAMKAAQIGKPYDTSRVKLFNKLADGYAMDSPVVMPVSVDVERKRYLPFYESYFSNYIEGTEFTVEEAEKIALDGEIPAERPRDAHDILGTYKIVSDYEEMSMRLDSADEFMEALRRRHASIMEGRPDFVPGKFKSTFNRAGSTTFVDPDKVEGTLRAGWAALERIEDPFARANFVMFMVSEVHPFADGNGRVSRIMMNGELERAGQGRIIVPTIMRQEYMSSLSAITNNENPAALRSVLRFAQRYTNQIDFTDVAVARTMLNRTNAFVDSAEAHLEGLQLILPSQLRYWEDDSEGIEQDASVLGNAQAERRSTNIKVRAHENDGHDVKPHTRRKPRRG